ncbi:hypothetical protein BH09VER1_BH09VER1_50850 [soil metagenome]
MSQGHQISLKVRLLMLSMAAGYLLAIAMAVSPALHHWVHQDSDEPTHHCVVTTLADGQVDSPALPPVLASHLPIATGPADLSVRQFALPVFSAGFALEHAPPVA